MVENKLTERENNVCGFEKEKELLNLIRTNEFCRSYDRIKFDPGLTTKELLLSHIHYMCMFCMGSASSVDECYHDGRKQAITDFRTGETKRVSFVCPFYPYRNGIDETDKHAIDYKCAKCRGVL